MSSWSLPRNAHLRRNLPLGSKAAAVLKYPLGRRHIATPQFCLTGQETFGITLHVLDITLHVLHIILNFLQLTSEDINVPSKA